MRILVHTGRLVRDIYGFAWKQREWWLIPVMAVLLLLALGVFVVEVGAPFIYTLF